MVAPSAALYIPLDHYWSVARQASSKTSLIPTPHESLQDACAVSMQLVSKNVTLSHNYSINTTESSSHNSGNNYPMAERNNVPRMSSCFLRPCPHFFTGLVLYDDGYFDGYDPTVNPGAGGDCHLYQ